MHRVSVLEEGLVHGNCAWENGAVLYAVVCMNRGCCAWSGCAKRGLGIELVSGKMGMLCMEWVYRKRMLLWESGKTVAVV